MSAFKHAASLARCFDLHVERNGNKERDGKRKKRTGKRERETERARKRERRQWRLREKAGMRRMPIVIAPAAAQSGVADPIGSYLGELCWPAGPSEAEFTARQREFYSRQSARGRPTRHRAAISDASWRIRHRQPPPPPPTITDRETPTAKPHQLMVMPAQRSWQSRPPGRRPNR